MKKFYEVELVEKVNGETKYSNNNDWYDDKKEAILDILDNL